MPYLQIHNQSYVQRVTFSSLEFMTKKTAKNQPTTKQPRNGGVKRKNGELY